MKEKINKIKNFFFPTQENNFKAPFILSRFLLILIIVFFCLKIFFFCFVWNFPKFNLFADISKNVLVSLTNQTRESLGVSILNEDAKLNYAAYLKAQDMLNYDYFAHVSPYGKTPWEFIEEAGYNYQYAGENLAMDFLDSGEVFQAWLNSPGHKANIVNSKFRDIGMAVVTGDFQGRQTTIVVQFFGTPISVSTVQAKEPSVGYTQPSTKTSQGASKPSVSVAPPSISVSAPMTLYEYFRQKGQPIPSLGERAVLFESLGLGSVASYKGLAWQNALLVNKLLESDKSKETVVEEPKKEVFLPTPTPTSTQTPETIEAPEAVLSPTQQMLPSPSATPTKESQPIFRASEIKVPPPPNSSFGYKALNFIAQNYDGLANNLFMIVFGMVFISICIDLAVKPSFKNTGLIMRGTIYSIVLLGLFLVDKPIIIKAIPHALTII